MLPDEDTGEIELKPENYSATHSLFLHSAALHKEEAKRMEATNVFLDRAIRRVIPSLELSCMRVDGACRVLCGNLYASAAHKEVKNEVGTGGATHVTSVVWAIVYITRERMYANPAIPHRSSYLTRFVDEANPRLLLLPDFLNCYRRSLDVYPQSGLR